MLENVEKSNMYHTMFTTPKLTFPHPIKKYIEKFTESELFPLRKHVGDKLLRMHYAKQLEDMFDLYDCYVPEKPIQDYHETNGVLFSLVSIAAFLKYRKCKLLSFSSYLDNIYAVSYIGLLSFTFSKWLITRDMMNYNKKNVDNYLILLAKGQIHSNNINVLNNLRFDNRE